MNISFQPFMSLFIQPVGVKLPHFPARASKLRDFWVQGFHRKLALSPQPQAKG
jgi:hypothetical protein